MRGPTRSSSCTRKVSVTINTAATTIPSHSGGLGHASSRARCGLHPWGGVWVRLIGLFGVIACSPRSAGAPNRNSAPPAPGVRGTWSVAGVITTTLLSSGTMRLGVDPDELGSPWSAALSSLGAFAAGAVVVVLPYGFSSALIAAIVLASLALFALFAVGGIGVRNGR